MSKLLSILGWCIVLFCFIMFFVGNEERIVGETLCVDGMNRINLEGIMCENIEYTWFGYHQSFMLLMLIPMFFALFGLCLPAHKRRRE